MEDYKKIAQECIDAMGGLENIKTVSMCTTRLRIEVHDNSIVDKERVKSIDKVKGIAVVGNQNQIILGNGTIRAVYKEALDIVGCSYYSSDSIFSSIFIIFFGHFYGKYYHS